MFGDEPLRAGEEDRGLERNWGRENADLLVLRLKDVLGETLSDFSWEGRCKLHTLQPVHYPRGRWRAALHHSRRPRRRLLIALRNCGLRKLQHALARGLAEETQTYPDLLEMGLGIMS